MKPSVGKQYLRTLPQWVDGGRRVIVTITRILGGIETLNGHDVEGNWVDSQGESHRGLFHVGDLTLLPGNQR